MLFWKLICSYIKIYTFTSKVGFPLTFVYAWPFCFSEIHYPGKCKYNWISMHWWPFVGLSPPVYMDQRSGICRSLWARLDKWCSKHPKRDRTWRDDLHDPTRPWSFQGRLLPWMGNTVWLYVVLLWHRYGFDCQFLTHIDFPHIIIAISCYISFKFHWSNKFFFSLLL